MSATLAHRRSRHALVPSSGPWSCAVLCAAVAALAAGCSARRSEPEPAGSRDGVCVVLPPPAGGPAAQSVDLLREMYPSGRFLPAQDFEQARDLCLNESRVLILPDAARFPADHWDALVNYLEAGGRAVLLGRDPFEQRVQLKDGHPRTEAELLDELAAAAQPIADFSDVQLWRHMNESGVMRGSVSIAGQPRAPWPAVEVEVAGFEGWDNISMELPRGQLPEHANTLMFYARGDRRTSGLVVTCTAQDGSLWVSAVPVNATWRRYALRDAAFRYLHGGDKRGHHADRLKLAEVDRVAVGLAMNVAPQSPGEHRFGVSDVRVACDPRTPEEALEWPDLLLVSPPYRRYEFMAYAVRPAGRRTATDLVGVRMQSPGPRPRGTGGDRAAPYRWVPLFEALDGGRELRGWPASMCVTRSTGGTCAAWAWVGVDTTKRTRAAVRSMVEACVKRLEPGVFLCKAGCDRFAFKPHERLTITAQWGSRLPPSRLMRVAAEIRTPDGKRLRRVASAPVPGGDRTGLTDTELDLGPCPEARERGNDYVIRVSLEAAEAGGTVYDVAEQPIRVVAEPGALTEADWLRTTGSRFTLARVPTFLLGVNYWPLSATGRGPAEYKEHWLEPGEFDPVLVHRDLDILSRMGVNAVAIQYHTERQASQLRFLAEECRRRDIWICAYVPALSPLDFNPDHARRLIEAAGLQKLPRVFALDLAWEPRLGPYRSRCRLDPAWREWLAEQYGSVEHAEQVLGRALWREGEKVTGPPDHELTADGEHRLAVAAYRRFVDDYVSRRYGHIRRFLHSLGVRQLLGARTGFGGTGQAWPNQVFALDPASGAVHLDFISPEAWGLTGPIEQFHEAGFITAYGRGVSDAKPVLWIEFGTTVGADPQAPDLEKQARIYEQVIELVSQSAAAGCFAWWYPSGYRVDEASDFGLVHPDGSLRPAAEVLRRASRRLRSEMRSPAAWKGREMLLNRDARGLHGLWQEWKDTYREETAAGAAEEIRPRAFGRPTTEMPLDTVGGAPAEQPAPLECANAEWGRIDVAGQEVLREPGAALHVGLRERVDLELINTGPATWSGSDKAKPRTVWVRAEHAAVNPVLIEVTGTSFGGRARVAWTASTPGAWRLRAWLDGVGGFGETLHVEVAGEGKRTTDLH
ncbi:MAG: hypothetical protein JXB04_12165 [Kiritimatiellae bacterium]|nr:hypothetical protein [Kiritimatiellia bacterium]